MRHRLAELAKLSLIKACHGLYPQLSQNEQMLSHPTTPHIPHPIPLAGLCFNPRAVSSRCIWHLSKWKQTVTYTLLPKGLRKNALAISVVHHLAAFDSSCYWSSSMSTWQHSGVAWLQSATRVYCQSPLCPRLNCPAGAIRGQAGPADHSWALESTSQLLGENHGVSAGARTETHSPLVPFWAPEMYSPEVLILCQGCTGLLRPSQ